MAIHSFASFGYEGAIVAVTADLRKGIPAVDIIGLSDGRCAATRTCVRSAIRDSGLEFPPERILISLSPTDLKKDGDGFDLAIALSILAGSGGLCLDEGVLVMGGLEPSGKIRHVNAMCAALQTASKAGIRYAILPYDNRLTIPEGMKVACCTDLADAWSRLRGIKNGDTSGFMESPEQDEPCGIEFEDARDGDVSLDEIQGGNGLKYAMAVSVAGGHHLMVWGAPGCGKSTALQRMYQLMPKLTDKEVATVDRIYSIAGLGGIGECRQRPFRMPHQTASIEGMCGGGVKCLPGEISLAHNGVLFLDDAAEFRSSVLQMMRIPLETGTITLSRAGRTTTYPAAFQLVMAMNPCPCGVFGSKEKLCLCSRHTLENYWKKFGEPLLSRIAIRYDCNAEDTYVNMPLKELRDLIRRAWETQYARQGKLNQDLNPAEVGNLIRLDSNAYQQLELESRLSPRDKHNVLKTARTIADMWGNDGNVNLANIREAIWLHARTPLENLQED